MTLNINNVVAEMKILVLLDAVARRAMEGISNIVARGKEDASSAVMQLWGFENYKP